ncbi:hypothetical protein HPB48_012668 [Haemaphysalis longicornis]|uniref:Carboxylic ester hydrolase n=1 Tax=Haemaphysalis longicornis TaxID=44386 RepID=A0A9J6FYX6_HAELO|nr:hypothetical protein HPB48_012668 [Haemaphysalis longicornis]
MSPRLHPSWLLHVRLVVFLTASVLITQRISSEPLVGEAGPVVRIEDGLIAGKYVRIGRKSVGAFLGIPYARAPVASLRFKKPQELKPWTGTLNATAMPKPCWQLPLRFLPNVTLDYTGLSSEDCLYLNVWNPATTWSLRSGKRQKSRPVVVFIHGGAFQWGDSALFLYNPSNFVALSDVVFVTFNYRVSILGFLSSKEAGLRGNVGLWDQNTVLKWVKKNIAQFGGDPQEVTLVGQSAGGISAAIHSVSPYSRGLFKRMVLQSGTPLSLILGGSFGNESKIIRTALELDCYDEQKTLEQQGGAVADCLRKVEVRKMFKTLDSFELTEQMYPPVENDDFVPGNILSADMWRHLAVKDILIGSTANEGTVFFRFMMDAVPLFGKLLFTDYRSMASLVVSEMFNMEIDDAKALVKAYFSDPIREYTNDEVVQLITKMIGDGVFTCPTFFFGEIAAAQGVNVYRYFFNYRATHSFWPKWMGVAHGDDIPYTMGSLNFFKDGKQLAERFGRSAVQFSERLHYTANEESFMKNVVKILSSFAKTG